MKINRDYSMLAVVHDVMIITAILLVLSGVYLCYKFFDENITMAIAFLIGGIVWAVYSLFLANVIKLIINVEINTHKTQEYLAQLVKGLSK